MLLSLFLFMFVGSAVAMELPIENDIASAQKVVDEWDVNIAINSLGHNPSPAISVNSSSDVIDRRITVVFHGLGGNGHEIYYDSSLTPGTKFSWNMPDTNENHELSLSKTSIGQKSEVLIAAYMLKKLCDSGIKSFDIQAHSRGAAVLVNLLRLLYKRDYYAAQLETLELDEAVCKQVLGCIKNMYILWPVESIKQAITEGITNVARQSSLKMSSKKPSLPTPFKVVTDLLGHEYSPLRWGYDALTSLSKASLASSIEYSVMPVVTSYNPWDVSIHDSLVQLQSARNEYIWSIFYLADPEDNVVGEPTDHYFDLLPAHDNYKVKHLSDGGRHMGDTPHDHKVINDFRKKNGGSYRELIND